MTAMDFSLDKLPKNNVRDGEMFRRGNAGLFL
jgi:hypothetical protein